MLNLLPGRSLGREAIEIISLVQTVTNARNIGYFLIGATARDILIEHVFGIAVARATRDVDFAIAVADWHEFQQVKDALVQTGRLTPSTGMAHRLFFDHHRLGENYPIDLIPFGQVERHAGEIAWPPDMLVVMNVAGYPEAMAAAVLVDIGQEFAVRVISLPALASLKLFAWADRGIEDNKDAIDLRFILSNYGDAGNYERLYGERFGLMEEAGYDFKLAGATLLGHDVKKILTSTTLAQLNAILSDPVRRNRLEIHMSRAGAGDIRSAAAYLVQFEKGLTMDVRQV